jgi:hypothetical protein
VIAGGDCEHSMVEVAASHPRWDHSNGVHNNSRQAACKGAKATTVSK